MQLIKSAPPPARSNLQQKLSLPNRAPDLYPAFVPTTLVECVPNFSEGRDEGVVRSIVDAIGSAPGALVLGWEMDRDHNRSVVT